MNYFTKTQANNCAKFISHFKQIITQQGAGKKIQELYLLTIHYPRIVEQITRVSECTLRARGVINIARERLNPAEALRSRRCPAVLYTNIDPSVHLSHWALMHSSRNSKF